MPQRSRSSWGTGMSANGGFGGSSAGEEVRDSESMLMKEGGVNLMSIGRNLSDDVVVVWVSS